MSAWQVFFPLYLSIFDVENARVLPLVDEEGGGGRVPADQGPVQSSVPLNIYIKTVLQIQFWPNDQINLLQAMICKILKLL